MRLRLPAATLARSMRARRRGVHGSSAVRLRLDGLMMDVGINVCGRVGSACGVDCATNLTERVTWLPRQRVTITTDPTVIVDYASPDQPKRFCRTVPLP